MSQTKQNCHDICIDINTNFSENKETKNTKGQTMTLRFDEHTISNVESFITKHGTVEQLEVFNDYKHKIKHHEFHQTPYTSYYAKATQKDLSLKLKRQIIKIHKGKPLGADDHISFRISPDSKAIFNQVCESQGKSQSEYAEETSFFDYDRGYTLDKERIKKLIGRPASISDAKVSGEIIDFQLSSPNDSISVNRPYLSITFHNNSTITSGIWGGKNRLKIFDENYNVEDFLLSTRTKCHLCHNTLKKKSGKSYSLCECIMATKNRALKINVKNFIK